MALYSVSGIVADIPDAVERGIHRISEHLSTAGAFIGRTASEHPNEFVIAISAVATAIFTCVLALRTSGLFKETAGLREETAALVKLAKKQSMDMQATLAQTERSANIAERALTDLERPHLFVEVDMDRGDISWSINGTPSPVRQALTYQFVNYGRTPGFLTEIVDDLRISEDLPPPVRSETTIATSLPGVIVGSGKPHPFTVNFPLDPEKALRGNARLYLFGRARYDDIFTNGYVVGFCLMLDHRSHRFVTSGDQRYNYSRKERDGFAKPT